MSGYGGNLFAGGFSQPQFSGQGGFDQPGTSQGPQEPSQRDGPKFKNTSIRPLTVRMLKNAVKDTQEILVDDKAIATCKLIGMAVRVDNSGITSTWRLDDGTGIIECKWWRDEEDPWKEQMIKSITRGAHIRVFGLPKMQGEEVVIIVHHAEPIVDFNEVTYHILDVFDTHLYNTRGPIKEEGVGGFGAQPAVEQMLPTLTPNVIQTVLNEMKRINQSGVYGAADIQKAELLGALTSKGITEPQLMTALVTLEEQGVIYLISRDTYSMS